MNLSASLVERLKSTGFDAVHARERGLATAKDDAILEHARTRGEAILTNDLDFGTLLAVEGAAAPSVVILRLRDQHPERVADLLTRSLPRVADSLSRGAIVVIEDAAIRVRMLPVGANETVKP